jgi:hypothetical protein
LKWEVLDEAGRVIDRLGAGNPELLHALRLGFRVRCVTEPRILVVEVEGLA